MALITIDRDDCHLCRHLLPFVSRQTRRRAVCGDEGRGGGRCTQHGERKGAVYGGGGGGGGGGAVHSTVRGGGRCMVAEVEVGAQHGEGRGWGVQHPALQGGLQHVMHKQHHSVVTRCVRDHLVLQRTLFTHIL